MFQTVSPPIVGSSKTVHTASGICESLLAATASVGELELRTKLSYQLSSTLAVAASKLDIYPMLCVQSLSSRRWAEKPPETCRALTVIKNIV